MDSQQTLKYLISIEGALDPSLIKVLQDAGAKVEDFDKRAKSAAHGTKTLADEILRMGTHALTIVPIWEAVRGATKAVEDTFGDAVKKIVEMDTALAKLRNTLEGVKDANKIVAESREASERTAFTTGSDSVTNLNIVRDMIRAGLDAKDAIDGMDIAVKGSIATDSDATDAAKMLANVYNFMGDKITEVSDKHGKMQYIMDSLVPIINSTTGSTKEYSQALQQFLPIASQAGLSLNETIRLIAQSQVMMQAAGKGGLQIATAFNHLSTQPGKVVDFLGTGVADLNIYQQFVLILQKINDSMRQGKDVSADVGAIFGLRALKLALADANKLNESFERLNGQINSSPAQKRNISEEEYQRMQNDIKNQEERLGEAIKNTTEAFVRGATGAIDYASALKKIADVLGNMQDAARSAGAVVRDLAEALALVAGSSLAGSMVGGLTKAAGFAAGAGGASLLSKLAGPAGWIAGAGVAAESLLFQYFDDRSTEVNQSNFQDLVESRKGQAAIRNRKAIGTPGGDISLIIGPPKDSSPQEEIKHEEELLKIQNQMLAIGYNQVEIDKARIGYLHQLGITGAEIDKERKKAIQDEYNEIIKNSEALQKSVSSGLSSLLQNKINFGQFAKQFGDTLRGGFSDSLAGNVTEQIFKTTGMGAMFGQLTSNIRHANDGPLAGPIMGAFDYGATKTHDAIVSGFNSATATSGTASFAGLTGGGFGGALTLPGFGSGGFFNRTIGGQPAMTGLNGQLLTAAGKPAGTATYGQAFGGLAMGLGTGYSAYQSAGGSQGNLSIPAGIFGTAGGLALAGSLGVFGGAGAALGAATGLSALAPLLGPIGIGLLVGSFLFSAFSQTKNTSTQTQTQTNQIASKIDVSNTQLQLVNRNLTALKSSFDTYIMPSSAYFSTKTNLEDQFAVDSRRS